MQTTIKKNVMGDQKSLYDDKTKRIMAIQSELSDMGKNRIELIRDLAMKMGIKNIGLANCVMFSREAKIIEQFLSKNFKVSSVDCKYGRLKGDDLFHNGSSRTLCNPAGLADFLKSNQTELNISIGLCVGHDIIFNTMSHAPVTTLFDKDFVTDNNPALAVRSL